jgi:flagellar protein FlaG
VDTEVDAEKDSGHPSRQPVNTEKRQSQGGRQEQSPSRDEPRHQSQSLSLSTTSEDLERDTEEAVSRLNDYVQNVKRDLVFDFDPDSGEPSVTVLDRESQRVLRQIDSKEALELARRLDEEESLSLFRTQV